MRHAVLGGGGIGGLLAAALARAGDDVVLLLRPESASKHGGRLRVESVVLGAFDVDVPAASSLAGDVDALWVTTKATQLEAALALAPPEAVRGAPVIPLLNSVDHLELLRRRYETVVAAAIRVESERVAPGVIRQKTPFVRVDMAGADAVQKRLRRAGIDCRPRDDGSALLWEKLAFLAPVALATTAFDAPLGRVRDDPAFAGCRAEALSAAQAERADVDVESVRSLHGTAPADMQSSMQKDVAAGREPELTAIAGPIVRVGREHGFPTDATDLLVDAIGARLGR
jgi:2-dehydropantoate 2-reductase